MSFIRKLTVGPRLSLSRPISRTLSSASSRNNDTQPAAMKSENPDVKHFLAIPWCAAQISEPGTIRETADSRFPKHNAEDELLSTTLHTDKTIAAYLTFYKRPSSSSSSSPSPTTAPAAAATEGSSGGAEDGDDSPDMIRELRALLTLRSGVNGYAGVAHGGIVATILDETIGLVFPVNKANGLIAEGAYMTAYLNTTYVRPVRTPQTVLCVAAVSRVRGRKYWVEGRIEDADGQVLARAESLYVKVREQKL